MLCTPVIDAAFSYIQTTQGTTLILYDGFIFNQVRRSYKQKTTTWKCCSEPVTEPCPCIVSLRIGLDGRPLDMLVPTHFHERPELQKTSDGKYIWDYLDEFPDWIAIYFVKASDSEMRCNLCEIMLKADEKSQELVDHLKEEHKDVYDLHKDNPEATVGFRIEFLNLNILKDDNDPKAQPVILEEVCETAADPIPEDTVETLDVSEIIEKDIGDDNMQLVLFDNNKKKKRASTGPRKRSWIWKYFDRLSNIIYRCRLCNVVLSIKGCNSNNMNRHVRTRHPLVFKSEVSKIETIDSIHVITSDDAPYAIKTEEIYASDKDYEEAPELEVTESPSQKLRRSWIWSYFNRVSPTQAQCKLCSRHICHGGNATGNMNRHLKMIHNKTASYDETMTNWVWKVFETSDNGLYYSCKICQYKCLKLRDTEKSMTDILKHLKVEHGVVSGDQIITGADVEGDSLL